MRVGVCFSQTQIRLPMRARLLFGWVCEEAAGAGLRGWGGASIRRWCHAGPPRHWR